MPTKWSFEVPIKHLNDFSDLQDFYFSLSMLYEDTTYSSYMRRQKSEGLKTLWLDNSFNEKFVADNPLTLTRLAKDFEVDKVISPDSPSWTTEMIKEAFIAMNMTFPSSKIIVVASSVGMMKDMIRIGASHIAVSYWVRPKLTQADLEMLLPCHYLGFLNPEEITTYHPPSCDTSMPIKLAMRGMSLQEWIDKGCEHINTKDLGIYGRMFFNAMLTDKQIEQARQNIKDLKEVTAW